MIKSFYLILLFVITYETIPNLGSVSSSTSSQYMYLPMKKDHKYGDDICYYREYDDKLHYYIFYVKPCEKGKYCQFEITAHPFGYCVDLPINTTTLSLWKESCDSEVDCQNGLSCINSKCTIICPNQIYQNSKINFVCLPDDERIDDNFCLKYDYSYDSNNNPTRVLTYHGNYPGLPNECGLINYKPVNYKFYNDDSVLEDDIQYIEENRKWCTIGSVPDNEFVTDKKYCYSGFALNFYPNKLYKNPSKNSVIQSNQPISKLCVSPIEVDFKNPLANDGCIITYQILEQNPKKYNSKLGSGVTCSETIVIESERYKEFIDAFNEANEEDKQNCYNIDDYKYRCKNVKLIKLWYFYKHPEDYLFYKDRDKLQKVLDFKIQREFPTYYEFTQYLNYSYLLFLLFLIIM